jgi:hypothetical protein
VTANDPQLMINYGRRAVTLNPITTIRWDGADLSWSPYVDPTPNSDPQGGSPGMQDRCGLAGGRPPAARPKPPDRRGTMTGPADTAAAWPEHAPLATTARSPELPDLGGPDDDRPTTRCRPERRDRAREPGTGTITESDVEPGAMRPIAEYLQVDCRSVAKL